METAFFWTVFGFVSFWALKTFYFSYDKDKLLGLRKTIIGINLLVIVLFFLPWLPILSGGQTGWELISQGNIFVMLIGIFIVSSLLLFLTKNVLLLKAGAVLHMITSVLFILTMIRLMPGTFILTFWSVAPIIASLLLLVGNVVALLLWQQLQLKFNKK